MTTTLISHRVIHPREAAKSAIYVTRQNKDRLQMLLVTARDFDARDRGDLKSLEEELRRAVIADAQDVPADVITMNSTAELIDVDTQERETLTLVFPHEADLSADKISVLAPIGAGMLGYRVGEEFEWKVPAGIRRMRVSRILYQPEAAGDFRS